MYDDELLFCACNILLFLLDGSLAGNWVMIYGSSQVMQVYFLGVSLFVNLKFMGRLRLRDMQLLHSYYLHFT